MPLVYLYLYKLLGIQVEYTQDCACMQEVRADVGVQWLLLTRTMEASRTISLN